MHHILLEQPYATCYYEIGSDENIYIHLDLKEWSTSIYKEMLADFADIKDAFFERGEETIYVIVPLHDEKLIKFEIMMGFEPELEIDETYLRLKQQTG